MHRWLAVLWCVAATGGPLAAEVPRAGNARATQNGVTMCIPRAYFGSPVAHPSRGPDDVLALIVVPQEEAAAAIPGYRAGSGTWPEFRVFINTDAQTLSAEQRMSPDMVQLWRGGGIYAERAVEIDPVTGYFRVSLTDAQQPSWFYFSTRPGPGTAVPASKFDFLVASCREGPHYHSPDGRRYHSCSREFLSGQLRLLYVFDEANMPLVAAMDEFLINKASSWRKACDQRG